MCPKKSKRWIANPENRVCDAPGSWYCTGQYPPALKSLIAKRKNFRQLEDFNVGQDAKSKKYQEEYHKQMSGGHPQQKAAKKLPSKAKKKKIKKGQFPQHGTDLNLKYVGCTGSEGKLGNDKEYVGGNSGANIELLQSIAWEKGKKYIALARVGSDGHSFVFNKKMKKPTEDDKGCNVPCGDHDGYVCGCSDGACGGLSAVKGEEHIRRWVVYSVGKKPDPAPEDEDDGGSYDGDDVPDDSEGEGGTKKEEKKTKKKRKKGNKKTRKSSDEL